MIPWERISATSSGKPSDGCGGDIVTAAPVTRVCTLHSQSLIPKKNQCGRNALLSYLGVRGPFNIHASSVIMALHRDY